MEASVCERCRNYYLPAEEGQRFCSTFCYRKFHKLKTTEVVVNRTCRVCGKVFEPAFRSQHGCGPQCAKVSLRKTRIIDMDPEDNYSLGEAAHVLPCLRCKYWTVNSESENGGYCQIGRWRICKPYTPGKKRPYRKKDK